MRSTQTSNSKEQEFIRLDKFLKVSRIIKRRSIAKDFCDASRVTINGNEAKAGSKVRCNDIITIKIGLNYIKAKVVSINEKAKKDEAKEMYEVLEEKSEDNEDKK